MKTRVFLKYIVRGCRSVSKSVQKYQMHAKASFLFTFNCYIFILFFTLAGFCFAEAVFNCLFFLNFIMIYDSILFAWLA